MTNQHNGRRLYWKLGIGLLAATGAYVWYASSQYERLRALYQRQLTHAAAELRVSFENARITVARFEKDGGRRPERFDAEQPYVALAQACHTPPEPFEMVRPDGSCFVFQAERLLHELSLSESFSLLFIALEDGTVVQQMTPGQTWLKHLRWGEQVFRDSAADQTGSLSLRRLDTVFDDTPGAWTRLRAVSSRTSQRIGGEWFEVHFEPLVIDHPGTPSGRMPIVLGAAVASRTLMRQALAVDSYFLAALVFLLLLGVLGFPFVKLLSLDAHERFRLRDVTLLYLSTAALLALFTFASHGTDGYMRWRATADRGLSALAEQMDRDLVAEVQSISDQVAAYDAAIAARGREGLGPPQTDWFGAAPGTAGRLAPPHPGAQIEQLSWIAPSGEQFWKVTTDPTTSLIDVSQRVYFRAVRDRHLYAVDETRPPFYLGPDRSIRDGKLYTFVAFRSRLDGGSGDTATAPVVVASTRLLSLSAPALPAGYGFAVINREGRVLYHSDERLSLRENLFDALSEGPRARAMVYANHSDLLGSRYRERPHRLHFRPVALRNADSHEPAGLYIVTFRDTSTERAVIARVFVIALLGPMLVLLLFIGASLLAMAVVPLRRQQRWSVWLWPHGGMVRLYTRLSTVLAGLLVGLAIWWRLGGSDVGYAAFPVVAMAAAIGTYIVHTRRPAARRGLSAPGWYATVFVLLLLCTVVIPASALFRSALGHEFGKLIATEQRWIADQRRDIPRRLEAEVRAERLPESAARRLADGRARYFTQAYVPHPFDVRPEETPDSARWLLAPFHWVDALLPIENDNAARLWYEDREWSYTPDGTWRPALPVSGGGVLCFVGLFGLLIWWMRWKVTHLFFADREATRPDGTAIATLWAACTLDEQLVLLQTTHEHVVNPRQRRLIEGLLGRGLLTLDPDLRPFSREFEAFILAREPELQAQLAEWETVDSHHSWRYARLVLVTSVAGIAFFLVATQPGLQSGLLGVATGVAGALTTTLKLKDAVASWMNSGKTTA